MSPDRPRYRRARCEIALLSGIPERGNAAQVADSTAAIGGAAGEETGSLETAPANDESVSPAAFHGRRRKARLSQGV